MKNICKVLLFLLLLASLTGCGGEKSEFRHISASSSNTASPAVGTDGEDNKPVTEKEITGTETGISSGGAVSVYTCEKGNIKNAVSSINRRCNVYRIQGYAVQDNGHILLYADESPDKIKELLLPNRVTITGKNGSVSFTDADIKSSMVTQYAEESRIRIELTADASETVQKCKKDVFEIKMDDTTIGTASVHDDCLIIGSLSRKEADLYSSRINAGSLPELEEVQ